MSEKERGNENLHLRSFIGVGKWGIPQVQPCTHYEAKNFISFNCAKTDKTPDVKGIHTFVDDYQILRVWNNPQQYIDLFRRFNCVMSPDYSLYRDYPLSMQMWNHYRKMWVTAYMQEYGVNMIPVACWSDEQSYDFCFDGMPKNSIIAVSNVGCVKGKIQQIGFKQGYEEMIKRLSPKEVLFYGQKPDWIDPSEITLIGEPHDRFSIIV